MRLEQSVLVNRAAQTSDTALYRLDLPKSGSYSALDVGIRVTNGSASGINMDILDVLDHISLVVNGNDYRIHIKGQDMFRLHWMKTGKPMPYFFTEAASGVNIVWFRLMFGRYLGDEQLGLNLAKYQNVQLQLDYDLTNLGAVASTTFTTATFTVTVIAHQFPYTKQPAFRGMVGCREFYTGTSAASGDLVQDLPGANQVLAVSVSALEDGVAEATDITDVEIGKDNFSSTFLKGKWYNFQDQQNAVLDVKEESYDLLLTSGAHRDGHLANIESVHILNRAHTAGA